MIRWGDVYKVIEAMVPLYVAVMLGYASRKWLHWFDADTCNAINRFNCYFILPFFGFQFTSAINPYLMNFRFLAADVIVKTIVGIALALWVNFCKSGNLSWATTSFSLSSFNNTLVVGVPLLHAMYGPIGKDIVVQSFVIQALIWLPLLMFLFEFRRARLISSSGTIHEQQIEIAVKNDQEYQKGGTREITILSPTSSIDRDDLHIKIEEVKEITTKLPASHHDRVIVEEITTKLPTSHNDRPIIEEMEEIKTKSSSSFIDQDCDIATSPTSCIDQDRAITKSYIDHNHEIATSVVMRTTEEITIGASYNLGSTLKNVFIRVAMNPNCFACTLGVIWALISKRWKVEMPGIVLGSIQIMAKAGAGVAMFNMGQFMALQERLITCGVRLTIYGVVLRFFASPLLTALGCFALGLRAKVLQIAIIQAALPQAIASFVYAQEVIFGTFLSLPLLIVYYIGLDSLH